MDNTTNNAIRILKEARIGETAHRIRILEYVLQTEGKTFTITGIMDYAAIYADKISSSSVVTILRLFMMRGIIRQSDENHMMHKGRGRPQIGYIVSPKILKADGLHVL